MFPSIIILLFMQVIPPEVVQLRSQDVATLLLACSGHDIFVGDNAPYEIAYRIVCILAYFLWTALLK